MLPTIGAARARRTLRGALWVAVQVVCAVLAACRIVFPALLAAVRVLFVIGVLSAWVVGSIVWIGLGPGPRRPRC